MSPQDWEAPGFPKTALLSVADTTGIVDFARGLSALGYRILSAGGTAKTLREEGILFQDVQELTGQRDLCAGRVRLLHPRLLAGIAADRQDGAHMRDLDREGIPPIDLVAVNLYPLAGVLETGQMTQKEAMEFVDAGGCALLLAAARNFRHVITLCEPKDYSSVLETLRLGRGLIVERSQSLAAKAFYCVSYYDATVAQYLSHLPSLEHLPDEMIVSLKKAADLSYGENPQQKAALYSLSGARPWGLNAAKLLCGKPLSYNHYLSMDRAVDLVGEFSLPACAIIKYGIPAGVAVSERIGEAARQAYDADPPACTGGVAAFNREVDLEAARALAPEYLECILAPEFSPDALDVLRAKKDVRLIQLPSLLLSAHESGITTVSGGVLIQDRDTPPAGAGPRVVTKTPPSEGLRASLEFSWRVSKHAATHAAVVGRGLATMAIAGGQPCRMDAVRLAIVKSQERHPVVSPLQPMVLASDGPLGPQEIREAAEASIAAVIQPGGSSDDREAVALADEFGLAMVFTGVRHFRH